MAHDQRDIALKPSTNSIEPTRTGPVIEADRSDAETPGQRENAAPADKDGAQTGYGNSRTADGKSDKDMR